MSRLKSLTLALLLVATLMAPISATVGAAGPKTMVDFAIEDITIGNASIVALQWDQPDGTQKDYYLNSQTLPIRVTFKQAGSSLQTSSATGYIEVWHPVGVKVAEWNFSLSLTGGQSVDHEVVWNADAAHSQLTEAGELVGGYIVKGVVDGGLSEGDTSNDAGQENVPIAVFITNMDSGACGDNDGDSVSDCPGATYNSPTFAAVGYEAGTNNPDGTGPWQHDTSGGYAGTSHWRHSVPGQDYVSNGNDHLLWGWFIPTGGSCEDPGHGLGYGITANEVFSYGAPFCKVSLTGGEYISMQLATQAWGGMGMGDEVALEASSAGTVIAQKNFTEAGISGATDDWTPIIWDIGANTSTSVFSLSYHFMSDNSGSSAGFHVDQFALFGIEKVNEYTINVTCDNPETGYVVIPADPMPPSLHCFMTNNGYREKSIEIRVNIDNDTWMNQFSPVRIDSNNLNDHDFSVPLNPLEHNETTEFWVNLTIPPGANVEQLNWNVSLLDYYTGLPKEELNIPLSVDASYSVDVTYYGSSAAAATLAPGEVGIVPFELTNTGNQMAYWNLNAFFNRSDWHSLHYRFLDADVNGSEITFIQLQKGQSAFVWCEFTMPDELGPGLTEVTIQAAGQSPATAQMTRKISIETSQVHDLTIVASDTMITAEADMHTRIVEFELTNNGNSPERFDLSLTADWHLGASVSQPQTEEIGGNGDSSTIMVVMPMPYGIRPDTYFLNLKATSQSDSTFFVTSQIELIVETTYLLNVEDVDMSGQTFQGGQDSKTISFEVTNNGNDYDEFQIELDTPAGMNAAVIPSQQYDPTTPPSVAQGASVNVTVEYSFDVGTNGLLELVVSAKSMQSGGNTGAWGTATFQVGSQGWIELTAGEMVVLDDDGWIYANLTIHNRHPSNSQFISLDAEAGDARQFASVRVRTEDTSFVLDPDLKRSAAVKFSLTETQFLNLPDDEMIFNITVIATGDDDVSEVVVQVKVIRESTTGGDAAGENGMSIANILAFIFGGIVVVALIAVLVKVVMSTNREEDEIISLVGYQRQLEDTYGSMPAAPDMPAAMASDSPPLPVTDTVANSAYGGAADIFEQQVTPVPTGAPPTPPPAEALPAGAPPLPPGGLPEGWDMQQWVHYGQQYRDQHNLD
ncbi:MAG: hypothetical protein HOE69_02585 [Euryarchaeota archaeon]|nr:hypothetical protein [Euryarchaeota archaeon]